MIQPTDLAFPAEQRMKYGDANDLNYSSCGLTKREYFAAMAMQGLCAINAPMEIKDIAVWSTHMADALIEQLNKQP